MGRAYSREGFVVGLKFRFTWACPRVWLARSGSPESDAISQSAVPLLGSCLLSGATPWTVLGFLSHGLGMQGIGNCGSSLGRPARGPPQPWPPRTSDTGHVGGSARHQRAGTRLPGCPEPAAFCQEQVGRMSSVKVTTIHETLDQVTRGRPQCPPTLWSGQCLARRRCP